MAGYINRKAIFIYHSPSYGVRGILERMPVVAEIRTEALLVLVCELPGTPRCGMDERIALVRTGFLVL